jgi:hypothetical protein
LIHAGGVRFFENGVVSLNFPVADEVVRARASRTTHPLSLLALQGLCSTVTGRDFTVDNPYVFKTKTEVTESLSLNNAAHLIPYTCSCAHLMFKSKTQWHCGTCSQCIDRRFAIIAAGLSEYDPETDYVTDVFLGARKTGPEKSMAVDYTRHGIELSLRSETELAIRFNTELSRAIRDQLRRGEAAGKIIAMHKRQGEVVSRVLAKKVSEHAEDLINGTLDDSSLLALVIGRRHLKDRDREITAGPNGQLDLLGGLERFSSDASTLKALLVSVIAKFETTRVRRPKKGKLLKHDAVIFAALLLGHKGTEYCAFLHDRGIKPRWSYPESRTETYPRAYRSGDPWRKKIQDEKTRANLRMTRYTDLELSTAFGGFGPDLVDALRHKLSIRAISAKAS